MATGVTNDHVRSLRAFSEGTRGEAEQSSPILTPQIQDIQQDQADPDNDSINDLFELPASEIVGSTRGSTTLDSPSHNTTLPTSHLKSLTEVIDSIRERRLREVLALMHGEQPNDKSNNNIEYTRTGENSPSTPGSRSNSLRHDDSLSNNRYNGMQEQIEKLEHALKLSLDRIGCQTSLVRGELDCLQKEYRELQDEHAFLKHRFNRVVKSISKLERLYKETQTGGRRAKRESGSLP